MRIRPSKRAWKRIGLAAAIVAGMLLVINAVMVWRVKYQIVAKMAAIRAAGQPTSLADLMPTAIPHGENGAAQIDALAEELSAFQKDIDAWTENTDLGRAYYDRKIRSAMPTAEQTAAVKEILNAHAALGEELARVAAFDKYASTLDYSLDYARFQERQLEQIQRWRSVGRYYSWQIPVLARDGRVDDAVRKGIELLRLARAWEHEPTLIDYFVVVAVREVAVQQTRNALSMGPASASVRVALEEELARVNDLKSLATMFATERAFSLDAIKQLGGTIYPRGWEFPYWRAKSDLLDVLTFYDAVLPKTAVPWFEQRPYPNAFGYMQVEESSELVKSVLPALQATYETANRVLCKLRALRVLNALQEFAAKNGREANGLQELALPATAMIDPYSGKPLILKYDATGWTVYGVGESGKDDGGRVDDFSDVGLGPSTDGKMAAGAAN